MEVYKNKVFTNLQKSMETLTQNFDKNLMRSIDNFKN